MDMYVLVRMCGHVRTCENALVETGQRESQVRQNCFLLKVYIHTYVHKVCAYVYLLLKRTAMLYLLTPGSYKSVLLNNFVLTSFCCSLMGVGIGIGGGGGADTPTLHSQPSNLNCLFSAVVFGGLPYLVSPFLHTVCTHIRTYVLYLCTCVHTYVCQYVRTAYLYTRKWCVCTRVCMRTCVCACVCVCICTHVVLLVSVRKR